MITLGVHLVGDGRMGTALRHLIDERDPAALGLHLVSSAEEAVVVVDYSHPDWTRPLIQRLLEHPRPVLVGTTGLTDAMREDLTRLSLKVPVMIAPNTGIGVQILQRLVAEVVKMAGPGWDIEILELHHRKKIDAPSGTAWALFDEVSGLMDRRDGVAWARERAVESRGAASGARTDGEIGVQSLRGGDVVGEHTVYLVGHGERLELTHRAWDRSTFARGGLRIARWLGAPGRTAGMYRPGDALLG